MYKYVKILVFVVIVPCWGTFYSYGQAPVNDLCTNAIDISDGLWHNGNTVNSTLSCTDFRLGNCATPQQTTNMCCGSSGVEGTIWYMFTSPVAGAATLQFRNSVCNPYSFFGIITTIQGFLITNNNCADPTAGIATACFNPPDTTSFSTPFTSGASQVYYVQVDTKKNTFTTCTCDNPSSATCHSSCAFQVRVVFPVATPVSEFSLIPQNNFVAVKWLYDWKDSYSDFLLVRKIMDTKDSVVLSSKSVSSYLQKNNYFGFNDYSLKTNGYYEYDLYAAINGRPTKLLGSEMIQVNFAKEISLNIIPNPDQDQVKLMLSNTAGNNYNYIIYNALGQIMKSGMTEHATNTETSVNISDWPSGIYLTKITLEDRILQQNILKE
ncbi:MAG TPA: T9SS type A sorting domain-containing protein [Cytophagaceae bacterium]|nr:T9SS type A sorting domain-containing protein [Cytophagaceae bacterium]